MNKSPTATKVSLDATLTRILGRVQVVSDGDTLGPPVKCIRCQDRGVIEYTSGTHQTIGNTLNSWHGRSVDATPEAPVYIGCDCRKNPQKGV